MPFRPTWKLSRASLLAHALVLALTLALSGAASAHRPLFPGPRAADPDSTITIASPAVSHVIYIELTPETPHAWVRLENDRPRQVAVRLAVPEEPRRKLAAPVLVLFGPGLPDPPEELAVAPPQGTAGGALTVIPTGPPEPFHEPVTGTRSRIVAKTQLRLPAAGTYLAALYDAQGEEGKAWISLGQREGFRWRDIARLPGWIRDVRRFHEVPGLPTWAWIGMAGVVALGSVVGRALSRR